MLCMHGGQQFVVVPQGRANRVCHSYADDRRERDRDSWEQRSVTFEHLWWHRFLGHKSTVDKELHARWFMFVVVVGQKEATDSVVVLEMSGTITVSASVVAKDAVLVNRHGL